MVERNYEQGILAEIPLKLRDEIERFQQDYTLAETKILDYKRIASKPYIDKSIEVVSHELYLEYGNLCVLITYWEKSFSDVEGVTINKMNLAQIETFASLSKL